MRLLLRHYTALEEQTNTQPICLKSYQFALLEDKIAQYFSCLTDIKSLCHA